MSEFNFDVEIPITLRSFRRVFAFLLVAGLAGDLASESVTLTTFYPAPSGAYSQLVVSQMAYAARDVASVGIRPNSYVEVGGFQADAAVSTMTGLTVNSISALPAGAATMAVGTLDPSATPGCPLGVCPALQIYDAIGGSVVDLKVNGQIQTGDGVTNQGGVCLNSSCTEVVGYVNTPKASFGMINTLGGYNGLFMSGANVGIGGFGATGTDPLSSLDVRGTINITDCTPIAMTTYATGPGTNTMFCAGPNVYATYMPGLYTYYQTSSDYFDDTIGKMYCCPCPSGTCTL